MEALLPTSLCLPSYKNQKTNKIRIPIGADLSPDLKGKPGGFYLIVASRIRKGILQLKGLGDSAEATGFSGLREQILLKGDERGTGGPSGSGSRAESGLE